MDQNMNNTEAMPTFVAEDLAVQTQSIVDPELNIEEDEKAAGQEDALFCPNCGAIYENAEQKFCGDCGEKLGD